MAFCSGRHRRRYRKWRLVSLDGSTRDVADQSANAQAFGRPGAGSGKRAYPRLRFVALATEVIEQLGAGMLCLADRNFFSFPLWNQVRARGAEL